MREHGERRDAAQLAQARDGVERARVGSAKLRRLLGRVVALALDEAVPRLAVVVHERLAQRLRAAEDARPLRVAVLPDLEGADAQEDGARRVERRAQRTAVDRVAEARHEADDVGRRRQRGHLPHGGVGERTVRVLSHLAFARHDQERIHGLEA